jgi:hypothetical protein
MHRAWYRRFSTDTSNVYCFVLFVCQVRQTFFFSFCFCFDRLTLFTVVLKKKKNIFAFNYFLQEVEELAQIEQLDNAALHHRLHPLLVVLVLFF